MKRTYTETTQARDLTRAIFELFITEATKYVANPKDCRTVEFSGVKAWSVITGEDANELDSMMEVPDEYHEYLILHFASGEDVVFRNSHVDMFII